jgi:hypothetical protein
MEINGTLPQTAGAPNIAPRVAPTPAGHSSTNAPAGGASPRIPSDVAKALSDDGSISVPEGSRIRVDKETDRIVLEIVNAQNRVIKQIPPEALLHALEQSRNVTGLILDKQT